MQIAIGIGLVAGLLKLLYYSYVLFVKTENALYNKLNI